MKLSIITVCYNCERMVKETLDSLVNQTFQDYEYIVIDGKSTDRTLEIIKEYEGKIRNIKIKSEPDKGIYDAMNKGIQIATGNYIFFLNIGDSFYDNYVLENLNRNIKDENIIYYGNVNVNGIVTEYPNKITPSFFLENRMICHQSIFAPSKILKNNLFNINYKYCADLDWLINSIEKKNIELQHIDLVVINYDDQGFSSQNSENMYKEAFKIKRKYYKKIIVDFFYIKYLIGKSKIGKKIKKIIKYKESRNESSTSSSTQ